MISKVPGPYRYTRVKTPVAEQVALCRLNDVWRGLPDHVRTKRTKKFVHELVSATNVWRAEDPSAAKDLSDAVQSLNLDEIQDRLAA